MAGANFFLGHLEEAVDWAARVLLEHPGQMSALWFHAAALAFLGRTSEANAAGRTILDVLPMARISSLDNWMTVARTVRLRAHDRESSNRIPDARLIEMGKWVPTWALRSSDRSVTGLRALCVPYRSRLMIRSQARKKARKRSQISAQMVNVDQRTQPSIVKMCRQWRFAYKSEGAAMGRHRYLKAAERCARLAQSAWKRKAAASSWMLHALGDETASEAEEDIDRFIAPEIRFSSIRIGQS